jgi:general secretion pathway protein A
MITGDPGAGKTLSLRCFACGLNPSLYRVIYFPLSTGSVADYYRGLAKELGEDPGFRKVDLFRQIQGAITTSYKERKITPVIILDELQFARDLFFHDLTILFNFQMDSENPFILILGGLPHLYERIGLNQYRPLKQRILIHYRMEPLTREEVGGYIAHQMASAGARQPIFTESAIEAIIANTMGWPRLVNNLASHCLLHAFQAGKQQIDAELVQIAAEEAGI